MQVCYRFFGVVLIVLLSAYSVLAHRGEHLAITQVEVSETPTSYIYEFYIENITEVAYSDVTIEFWVNSKVVQSKIYDLFAPKAKFVKERFIIPKSSLSIETDIVNIEITKIFGKSKDWGGWDAPIGDVTTKQVNTAFSEFYVDAPWRMKRTDAQGADVALPLHFFLHDGHDVIGTSPQIDKIEIRIKNASSSSFGPVLTFGSMTDTEFEDLFSCISVVDNAFGVQGFSMNSFSKSNGTSIDFDLESDIFSSNDYVEVDAEFWYFNFDIPGDLLIGYNNVIDIQVTIDYDNTGWSNDIVGMRVFRSDDAIPTLPNYYRGDTHLHSIYTQNDAELGLPLCATKEAGKHIGLDWITTTDHTSDFDNYGSNLTNNWARIKAEAQQLNAEDASLIYIPGQEVALNNHDDKLVHMLAYPNKDDIQGFEFIGDGDGDLVSTNVSVNSALNHLFSIGGFAYGAHPFATGDKLPLIPVDGGIWNLSSTGFPANGDDFPQIGGEIICNDLGASSDVFSTDNSKLVKDGLKGVEIWNVRNELDASGDELDPWDTDGSGDGFSVSDTADYAHHIKKFRQGLEVTSYVNQLGLQLKNQDDSYQNWKLYFSAGSDAHGSFNSSNTGDFAGFGTIDDNAVGKLNTLVYCPNGMGIEGENILDALYNGRNVLSDGPIMAIGVSSNGDDANNEILMGDDDIVNKLYSDTYYLNFDYATSDEFGDVTSFKLILGTSAGEYRLDMGDSWALNGTNHESVLLDDVLLDLFPGGAIVEDEFFYLRAELETYKDLSAQTSEFINNHTIRNSFSNPIWLKYSEVLSEVDELTVTAMPNPFQEDFTLVIQSTEPQEVIVGIYDKLGKLIKREKQFVNLRKEIQYSATSLGLANGTYTIRVMTEEETKKVQVVKI